MKYVRFRFAGLDFQIFSEQPLKISKNFQPFLVDDELADISFEFKICEQLEPYSGRYLLEAFEYDVIETEEKQFIKVFRDPLHDNAEYAIAKVNPTLSKVSVQCLEKYISFIDNTNNCLFHSSWEQLITWKNRLILHASYVKTQYGGILFSGVSGIGKSTQANLWEQYESAEQINGDRPILFRENDNWMGSGSPYAGSSEVFRNEIVPVRAIVMLSQGTQCSIRRLNMGEAFRKVYAQCTVYEWDKAYVEKVSDNVTSLITEIPVYHLTCTPDQKAVELLKSVLQENNHGFVS